MKRAISFILCAVLMSALVIPALAAEGDELAGLILSAKKALLIPEEYTEFESSKEENLGQTIYSFMWSSPEEEKRIYCEILSTGEIVSYESSQDGYDSDFVAAAFDREKYAALASEWIKKVNPKYAKELGDGTVNINSSSRIVRVSFPRVLSEIPVYGNEISLSLDKSTGEIIRMYANFDIAEKIEKEDGTIDEETAKAKLSELFAPTLKYKKLYGENRAVLVYEPKSRGDMISARDGERFTVTYLDNDEPLAKDEATSDSLAGGSNSALNRAEISAVEEIEKLLSKQEIEALIRKLVGSAVARYDIQSVYYTKTEKANGEKFYTAFAILKGDGNTYGEVVFNAETGELLSLYSYDGTLNSVKQKTDEETLRKTAERFVGNFAPEEAKRAEIGENFSIGRYVFTERVNGIEYDANRISVYVNEKNGKVMSFSKNWEEGTEFDAAENLISAEDAFSSFVSEGGCEKYYIADGIRGYRNRTVSELRLIWKLSDETPAYVDAKTGKPLGWDLKTEEKEEEYKPQEDLKGHFAESAVRKLANNGIILTKKEKFAPNEAISRREMVYLLFMFERGYYTEPTEEVLDEFMTEAKRREIISDASTPSTSLACREEAASVIANLFGYKRAASIAGIYKTGFSDEAEITKEYLGGVAIAKGLGIINGSGGRFSPRRAVTRGEFAVMLANSYGK